MKIVVLTSRIPYPLEKGDKLRIFHQIKHLSESHEICLICLNENSQSIDTSVLREMVSEFHVVPISKWKIPFRLIFALFHNLPFQVEYFLDRKNKKKIEAIIQDFNPNHIYCQLIRTAEYVKNLFQFDKTIDYMDAFSAAAMRRAKTEKGLNKIFWKIESGRVKNYERSIFDYFKHHAIITEQDRNLLAIPSNQKITIVPNGVDTSHFKNSNQNKKYDLVFAGNMNYPPNIAAAIFLVEEILPKLLSQFPNVTLLIAGANPSSDVQNLASENVTVSGWMNDIREAYCESRVFVAPMFIGAGMQNKILEAMSSELPVITTSLAAEAFPEKKLSKLIEANTAFEFAKAIQYYLLNEAAQLSDGKNNRLYVEEKYSWKISNKKLDQCLSNQSS
jgi:sugar transferase (PEP-CTERM/EpsH1 system associated)